jgi:hypothetical protein
LNIIDKIIRDLRDSVGISGGAKKQNRQVTDFIGGSAWTRTCNQTVMNAGLYRKVRTKSALPDQDQSRLCAFVHGG